MSTSKFHEMLFSRVYIGAFLFFAGIISSTAWTVPTEASEPEEEIQVNVFTSERVSLSHILEGGVGTAYLLYSRMEDKLDEPLLVVHFLRRDVDSPSMAYIFQTPEGEGFIPISFEGDLPQLPENLHPTITMEASEGWWVRQDLVNYNLNISIYGSIAAMWGSFSNVKFGAQAWNFLVEDSEPNANIIVRDVDRDGVPDWDWRTMSPEFRNRADYRTNYTESKCKTVREIHYGVFPKWPFVTGEGEFEQPPGHFHPPIVVDWKTGRIVYFSELVTARNQNCSYTIYSIKRIHPHQFNHPNFETPFTFYDLSGEGVGYPNLIIRTLKWNSDDKTMYLKNNSETQIIRYSWRNQIGDRKWDYAVNVLGQHDYDFQTPIADGQAYIDAPDYESFPSWVVERDWPVVTFVAIGEDTLYLSSEGIYEWSPIFLSEDFVLGWEEKPNLETFQDTPVGFRGEYRLESLHPPEMYLSPIDNRLHLKWADQGVWRFDDEQILRVINLDGDEKIDAWSRELKDYTVEEDARAQTLGGTTNSNQATEEIGLDNEKKARGILESLYALNGFLFHNGNEQITIVATEYEPILFETLPPTDHETWEFHRTLLAPYEEIQRDPTDLYSWLDAFSGDRTEMTGANLTNLRIVENGFRFELRLESDYQFEGPDLLNLSGLKAGKYLVEYRDNEFNIAPLVPADFTLEAQYAEYISVPSLQLSLHNKGTADAPNLQLIAELLNEKGEWVEFGRQPIDILANSTQNSRLDIPSNAVSSTEFRLIIQDEDDQTLLEKNVAGLDEQTLETVAVFGLGQIPILTPMLILFGLLTAAAILLTFSRKSERSFV